MRITFRVILVGAVAVFLAVVTVVAFVPALIWKPARTVVAHPYTAQQEHGRELFYKNGCLYCHSQYVRDDDTGDGNKVSAGGDYVFDNPMTLGSERTGPDLTYIGRKRGEAWDIAHYKDPRRLSPLSIMPSFKFLSEQELKDLTAYIFNLGNRVAMERMIIPPITYKYRTTSLAIPTMTLTDPDAAPQGWEAWNAAGLQEGKLLYVERCLTCHGCAGNGQGTYAGTLVVTPANFKDQPIRSMPDDQWYWHVSEGIQGTVMPTWKTTLSVKQRWHVIRYVQQIFAWPHERDPIEGRPPGSYANLTNPVKLTVDELERVKSIWTRECLPCHAAAGSGDGAYGDKLEPLPSDFRDKGHYGTLDNPIYTDSDYFWRISEGLPWAAMPAWKSQYSTTDRWGLVHYIRVNFTQTEARPERPRPNDQVYPSFYLAQKTFPAASFARGQRIYINDCANCHGLSGEGEGWDGAYLDVLPADFTYGKAKETDPSKLYAMTVFGVQNSAMPSWSEQLPDEQLWDVVTYINKAFQNGGGVKKSQFNSGKIAATTITLSEADWTKEGHVISADNGAAVYANYCALCHGTTGNGNGYSGGFLPGGPPAAFNPAMTQQYAFWRIWYGVPNSVMPPFYLMLAESDIWDVVTYSIGVANGTPVGNAANAPTQPVYGALPTGTLPIGLGGGR